MADPIGTRVRTITEKYPKRGLSVARMIAHITYLSESAFKEVWKKSTKQ